MEYKVKYIGPESIFSHPGITRIGKHPYVFVGNAYTTVDNETDYNYFKESSAFVTIDNIDEATAVKAKIETPKPITPKAQPRPKKAVD